MIFEVVYYSRSGNTGKVAGAIARELGVTARDIKTVGVLSPDAFVFLGTGCYGAVLPKDIGEFLKRNRFNGRKIALFTTSAFGADVERNLIKNKVTYMGAEIVYSYSCLGQWMSIKKQHPTSEELEKAREFARSMVLQEYPQIAEMQPLAAAAAIPGR